jgi:MFS family permease
VTSPTTREQHLALEDSEDALLEGDRPFAPGTARAALAHRTFRMVFFGAFASNIGTWMQNVVLGAFAYTLTRSPTFVGLLTLAQLGPSLLLGMVGGLIADIVDRRKLLIAVSVEQLAFSLALAAVARADHPSQAILFLLVLAIGVGQAIFAPAYSAILPGLVGREDLAGAISLNSAQMNGSRVIGPVIGAFALHQFGPAWVFAGNAVTYLFVVAALLVVTLPPPAPFAASSGSGLRQLTVGIRVARADRVVGRALVTVFVFSLVSLVFVGQMPTIAAENLGLAPTSVGYGVLYATFGTGALVGALSIGTVLASRSKPRLVRIGLVGFAVSLAVFAVLRSPTPAYPAVGALGFFYFGMITSLSTTLQQRLDDAVRGRVMALWIMGFGGTVGLGQLVAGPIIEHTSITAVMLVGALMAVALAVYADVSDRSSP